MFHKRQARSLAIVTTFVVFSLSLLFLAWSPALGASLPSTQSQPGSRPAGPAGSPRAGTPRIDTFSNKNSSTVAAGGLPSAALTIAKSVSGSHITRGPNWGSNGAMVTTGVVSGVDLEITKAVTPPFAAPGQLITYTLVFTNNSPATVYGVLVTDTLPVTVTGAYYIHNGSERIEPGDESFTWRVSAMDPGESFAITITGVISPDLATNTILTNVVTVTAADDVNPNNNTASVTSRAGPIFDLAIAKSVDPESVAAGDTVTYTLVITNRSLMTVTGATLSDTLPPGIEFGAVVTGGATYDSAARAVRWTGALPTPVITPGAIITIPYTWFDIGDLGTTVPFTLAYDIFEPDDEGQGTVDLPWPFPFFGTSYTTLSIGANGNVGFNTPLLDIYDGERAIPHPFPPNNRIAALYRDLLGPDSGCVEACALYTYHDTSEGRDRFIVQYHGFSTYLTNEPAIFQVVLYPDGQVEVYYNMVPKEIWEEEGYTEPLPVAGVENASGTSGISWTGTIADETAWRYLPGEVGPPVTHTIVYTATVSAALRPGAVLTNTAEVSSPFVDPDPSNNIATAAVTVTLGLADLAIAKSAAPNPVVAGGMLTYTLVYTNNGPGVATAVAITDAVPVSLTNPVVTWSGARITPTAALQYVWEVEDLLPGEGGIITITGRVTASLASGESAVLTNTAEIAAQEEDPQPVNNRETAAVTVLSAAPGNVAPIADAGPDQEVLAGTLVTLDGSGSSDPDGHLPLDYGWEQIGGPPVSLSAPTSSQTTFMAPSTATVLTFTLTVTDALGLASTPDMVVVTVREEPEEPGGSRVYLPVLVRPRLPDLVGSFTLTPDRNKFETGEPVTITVTITNQGTAPSGPFWVDLYISPNPVPVVAGLRWDQACAVWPCDGIAWAVEEGLPPGGSITLTSTPADFSPAHTRWYGTFRAPGTHTLYLFVDSWNGALTTGAVNEADEWNNRAVRGGIEVVGEPLLFGNDQAPPLEPRWLPRKDR